ncbi:MAG TPA: antibiotic biosynthesis monooxygenase [Gammaproteobacteria bacterium]|jgi:quinol monooxygenase YgiN|nr:antibiotic biosynthesis monooxygenase [Gammaproteobacteria bacterium]|tara:strand:+ start:1250 stop:1531 length:282 start_codon:yes stop_codon:yes gene_type:complete
MIGIVATLKIKEDSGAEFEAVASQLVEKVNANEDGVVYYDLYKENETTYVFLERYKDKEAQEAHGKTDYFRALGAQMGPFMAGAPEIKVLASV